MPERTPISLLVVEDEAIHRDLVADCLSDADPPFELTFATTCHEAEELLLKGEFQCVLLDHSLPDGTGADLLDKAQVHLLTTPVVAFSTSADPAVALADFRGGCIDFILKRDAFKTEVLAGTIQSAVSRSRLRAVVERAGSSAALVEQAAQLLESGDDAPAATRPTIAERLQLIYEAAVRTIENGVMLIERRERVVYSNPGLKRILGLAEVMDLPGHPRTTVEHIFTPDAAEAFRTRPTARARYESSLRAADGREVAVLIGETPLGRHGVLCAIADLSEIKAQQHKLEEKNRRLAELYDMGNRFVDNVSHEFRTPLTVIKGYTELMLAGLAGTLTDEQGGYLRTIIDRTRDLTQMVDDLLDTSKLRAGCLRVDRRPQTLAPILARIKSAIDQKAAAYKTRITQRIPGDLPVIYADGEKVGRVILNLVVNAIKFSPEGSEVIIWATPTDDGDLTVGVTDHGPGISPENLSVIFDRFKQVGDPRSSTKGFGLGLNIANELVAMNLGFMRVQSEPGKGSTFTFTVPKHDPLAVVSRLLRRQEAPAPPAPAQRHLAVLRAHPAGGESDQDELHVFLASHTFPMDLIFSSPHRRALHLVGITTQSDEWAERLRRARASAVAEAPGAGLCALELKVVHEWPVPIPERNLPAVRSVLESELSTCRSES